MPRGRLATRASARPRTARHPLATAALLAAFALPAAADLRSPLPTPAPEPVGYALHADSGFGRVYAEVDPRRGAAFGLRYTRSAPGIGSYHHRWLLGVEQRQADIVVPHLTVRPISIGYAAGWADGSRDVDGRIAFRRNLQGGQGGYSLLRYQTTVVQQLPATWRLKLVSAGQYSAQALVPSEQFALGGDDTLRGFDERALTGDSGRRHSLELQTPDLGRLLKPRLSAQGLVFLDQGSVAGQQTPGETRRIQAASVGIGLEMSMARSWQLRAELAHVRRDRAGELDLEHERGRLTVSFTP